MIAHALDSGRGIPGSSGDSGRWIRTAGDWRLATGAAVRTAKSRQECEGATTGDVRRRSPADLSLTSARAGERIAVARSARRPRRRGRLAAGEEVGERGDRIGHPHRPVAGRIEGRAAVAFLPAEEEHRQRADGVRDVHALIAVRVGADEAGGRRGGVGEKTSTPMRGMRMVAEAGMPCIAGPEAVT